MCKYRNVGTQCSLDLKDSVGGYANAVVVVGALQSDGYGGTRLLLGSEAGAPRIDFVNTASSLLTSAHFKVG